MRILYICHRIPYPPDKGEKIRAFHQLRAIAAQHEVDLFTLSDQAVDQAHVSALRDYCQRITVRRLSPHWARLRALPSLFTRTPLTLPYFYSRKLDAQIHKAIRERSYDRIFVYCSAMAQYVDGIDQIPIILDLVDADSDKWSQYADFSLFPFSAVYRREARCLRAYERKSCKKSSCVLVTTEREAQLIRQIAPEARVHVIHIGIDTNHFSASVDGAKSSVPTVVFTGDMSYFPNQEAVKTFARQVLPIIHRTLPSLRFLIVGRNPSRQVRTLEKLTGVQITGSVPHVRAYLATAHVSVAPFSIAAGIQTKILEAMACGLPVVATSRAVRGLKKPVAEIIETGNSAEELAARVVKLIRDPQLARRTGMESRRLVAAEYSWEEALDHLLQLLENPVRTDMVRDEAPSDLLTRAL